jgi:hypothetical protein
MTSCLGEPDEDMYDVPSDESGGGLETSLFGKIYFSNKDSTVLFLRFDMLMMTTHVKTHKLLQVCKQVVTNLFTKCQQVVFALLVRSNNKFGTSC